MQQIPISIEGFRRLEREVGELKKARPEIIQAIAVAREEGDLRENAGYEAARDRQGMLEARIRYIETRLATSQIIDMTTLDGDKATFGATVQIEDVNTGEVKTWTLLGPDESDPAKGSISILSPVGQAIIGKVEGDEVVVDAPRGKILYEIVSIRFNGPQP